MVIKETRVTANYTMLVIDRRATPYSEMRDIEQWCLRSNCGKKVNRDSFAFKTGEELTMFTLRWR